MEGSHMSWVLFLQIALLIFWTFFCVCLCFSLILEDQK